MGFHTFPMDRADALDDPTRYRFCSREELLEMLDPTPDDTIIDAGSGTGFYTDEIAPFVGRIYAVDLQRAMHERHRDRGVSHRTALITADVSSLPVADTTLDGGFSVMTHHEYASEESMTELARVVRPGGRFVTIDWSRTGRGDDGPPLDERFAPGTIATHFETVGFAIEMLRERPETVAIVARR